MDRLSSLLSFFSPRAEFVRCFHGEGLSYDQSEPYPMSDIFLLYEGEAEFFCENQRYALNSGDLVWVALGKPFSIKGKGSVAWVQARLDFGQVKNNPLYYSLPAVVQLEGGGQDADLQPIIALMLEEARKERCGHQTAVNRLAEVLLIHILRFVIGSMQMEQGVLAGLSDLRLARVLTQIHENPSLPWTLALMSKTAGMSRTSFSQRFKAVVGISPGEYLKQWRMQLGHQWLGEGGYSVGQVADKLGYQSETAFRRVFRQVMGEPPGSVRRKAIFR